MEIVEQAGFAGWVILELMGHRRLGGYLSEEVIGGGSFLRLDVPGEDGQVAATQYYAPAAVYCITPTSEETALAVAKLGRPAPVERWELAQLGPGRRGGADDDEL